MLPWVQTLSTLNKRTNGQNEREKERINEVTSFRHIPAKNKLVSETKIQLNTSSARKYLNIYHACFDEKRILKTKQEQKTATNKKQHKNKRRDIVSQSGRDISQAEWDYILFSMHNATASETMWEYLYLVVKFATWSVMWLWKKTEKKDYGKRTIKASQRKYLRSSMWDFLTWIPVTLFDFYNMFPSRPALIVCIVFYFFLAL